MTHKLTPLEAAKAALRKAEQLAGIATDWNLDEVEIDGEMVCTYTLRDEFKATLAAIDAAPAPEPPAMAEIERAWHKARDAWLKQSRHGTQASADKAAIDVLASALAQPRDTVGE